MASATVAEIGRRTGYSTATVSRTLSGSGSVSAKTREAILKAVREAPASGVSRKRAARGTSQATARLARTGLIEIVQYRRSPYEEVGVGHDGLQVGPMVPAVGNAEGDVKLFHLSNSFYREMVDAAITEAARWHHRAVLQLCHDLRDPRFQDELIRPDRNGVLLVGEPSDDLAAFVARCPHPLVLVDIAHDGWPDVVTTDGPPGVAMAFDHLYQLGHRRFGFGGRADSNFAYAERYVAFKMKMAEAALPVRDDWVYEGYTHIGQAEEGVRKLLSLPQRPTALVCANDCVALGAIRAAQSLGLNVPSDVSIVGFDGIEAGAFVSPQLTTVRVPTADIGRQAVRQLMLQVQAGVSVNSRGTRIRLLPELIVRGSTGAPRNN